MSLSNKAESLGSLGATQQKFDRIIDKLSDLQLAKNVTDNHPLKVPLRQSASGIEFLSGSTIIDQNQGGKVRKDENDPDIMLASVSKVAISLALCSALEDNRDKIGPITLPTDAIGELFGRDAKHLSESPSYEELVSIKGVSELLHQMILLQERNDPRGQREIRDSFLNLIKGREVNIDLDELYYQVLTISSNRATVIAKKLIEIYSDDYIQRLKTLAPKFSPSPDTNRLQHWDAVKPNVGPISEHLHILHKLVEKSILSPEDISYPERLILKSLENNSTDYDFCFTHSRLGQELISKGYSIFEKTGYYPMVHWVKEFLEGPYYYPPHMVMASIVTIVDPNGKVHSFSNYKLIAHRLPMEFSNFENADGELISLPDEWAPGFATKTKEIRKQYVPTFRAELEQIAAALIPRDSEID